MSVNSMTHPSHVRTVKTSQKSHYDRVALWFILPSSTLILALLIIPILIVIALSFTNYSLGGINTSFVGIENYIAMFNDRDYWNVLVQTLIYALIVVPSSVFLGLALALLVQSVNYGRKIYLVLFFLPVTATLVAMATVWKYLLHGTIGPVNYLLSTIEFSRVEFFGDPAWVLLALSLIGIWQLAGFNMVLFIAGLMAIPQELYDASRIDGADRPIDRLFTVTLPLLSPTMLFVIVTSTITSLKVFDTVAVLTKGGPQDASNVILYDIYLEGFQYFRTGSAAAMTVIFLFIILLMSWIQTKVIDKKVHYT